MSTTLAKRRHVAARCDHYQRKVEREELDGYGWVMSLDTVRTPEEILLVKQRMERLEARISKLPARIDRVLRMRLGINCKSYTFEEIAQQFGVTRERIRQMENKGLRIIKRWAFIEEQPEEYRRERDNVAKAYKARREAEKAAEKAHAEARQREYEADFCEPDEPTPVGVFHRSNAAPPPHERTILDEIVAEQKRANALEREYMTWATERAKWLASPMPEWAQIEPYVNKPYLYKLRKVQIKRDWLNVATEGFRDGA